MVIKKVLIITYYWPPSGGVGVQRWLHFAVNLKKLGIEPIIYTPENPSFEISDKILENVAKDIKIVKSKIWEPFSIFHTITGSKKIGSIQQGLTLEKSRKSILDKLFVWIRGNLFIPDSRIFWVRPSVRFLTKYITDQNIDCVISTGPPHSMHLIALQLKKRIKELKWIADFRDPWSDWDILMKLNTGQLAMKRHRYLETQVLSNANKVISVSKRLGIALESKVQNKIKVDIVMNGVATERIDTTMTKSDNKGFAIGYFGMLNELRNPEKLWIALEKICEENPEFRKNLEIRLGGIVSESILDRIKKSKFLGGKVIFLGYLSHDEVFQEYQQCDLLVLLLNKTDNAKWILPVKFFEYLSAHKPILTVGPEDSDLGDIISNYKIGDIISGEDEEGIKEFVLDNFTGKYETESLHYEELLSKYTRESQAKELADLIDRL